MTIGSDEVPSASSKCCTHERESKVFKISAAKKKLRKLKNGRIGCEACEREESRVQTGEVLLCVTCGFIGCAEKHITSHLTRVSPPHPIYVTLQEHIFKCLICQVVLNQDDDKKNNSLIMYCNSFKSIMNSRSIKAKINEYPSVPNNLKSFTQPQKENLKANRAIMESMSDGNLNELKVNAAATSTKGKGVPNGLPSPKGLTNNGNTCFFNAVLQCMLHTYPLQYYFEHKDKTISLKLSEDEKEAPVTFTFNPFQQPLHNALEGALFEFCSNRTVIPGRILSQIATRASRFSGYYQQDAHELLRYFLDGLRMEEIDECNHHINERSNNTGMGSDSAENGFVKERRHPSQARLRLPFDAIFGGTLLQTILCSNCGHLSKSFEQFFDISLPMPCSSKVAKSVNNQNGASPIKKVVYVDNRRKKRKALQRKNEYKLLSDSQSHSDIENDNVDDGKAEFDSENCESVLDGCNEEFNTLSLTEVEACLNSLSAPSKNDPSDSLSTSLSLFTSNETLRGSNAYECEKCCLPHNKALCNGMVKRFVEARKRYLIYEPPAVLILHLKRFEQVNSGSRHPMFKKMYGRITFPLLLNLARYCTSVAKRIGNDSTILYALYGVVCHMGDMGKGHYIAYVRNRPVPQLSRKFYELASKSVDNEDCSGYEKIYDEIDIERLQEEATKGGWYFTSDTSVSSVSASRVLNDEAYILFYERVG